MTNGDKKYDSLCPSTHEVCRSREMLIDIVLGATVEQIGLEASQKPIGDNRRISKLFRGTSGPSSREMQDELSRITDGIGEALDNPDTMICKNGVCGALMKVAITGINNDPKTGYEISVKPPTED